MKIYKKVLFALALLFLIAFLLFLFFPRVIKSFTGEGMYIYVYYGMPNSYINQSSPNAPKSTYTWKYISTYIDEISNTNGYDIQSNHEEDRDHWIARIIVLKGNFSFPYDGHSKFQVTMNLTATAQDNTTTDLKILADIDCYVDFAGSSVTYGADCKATKITMTPSFLPNCSILLTGYQANKSNESITLQTMCQPYPPSPPS